MLQPRFGIWLTCRAQRYSRDGQRAKRWRAKQSRTCRDSVRLEGLLIEFRRESFIMPICVSRSGHVTMAQRCFRKHGKVLNMAIEQIFYI